MRYLLVAIMKNGSVVEKSSNEKLACLLDYCEQHKISESESMYILDSKTEKYERLEEMY